MDPESVVKFDTDKTSVTLLQDVLNKQGVCTVQYDLLQIGGAVGTQYQYRVTDGRFIAYGKGKSKREAKQNSAKALLRIIHKEFPDLCSGILLESQIDCTSDINESLEAMNFGDNDKHNPIGMLQELCSSLRILPPVYVTECEDGPPHQRLFTVSCNVSDYKGTGKGKTKKIAKHFAANDVYLMLKSEQADLSKNSQPTKSIDDFIHQEFNNLSGLKNSKSTPQFHRLPTIHRNLPLTEGPCYTNIKDMEEEELYSCDTKQILESFTTEQGLKLLFIDFEKLSNNGQYQTSLQIFTPITMAFHGESSISYEEAQQKAAYRSLVFFKCLLNNRALKSSTMT